MSVVLSGFNDLSIDELVKIHREAFSEHYNSKLGDIYTKAFLRWFGKNQNTVFVQASEGQNGKTLGYICGALEGYGNKMNKDLFPYMVASFVIRPWIVADKRFFKMFLPKLKVILSNKSITNPLYPEDLKPAFSAVSLATDPSAPKDYKLSDILYDEFLKKAKELGAKSVKGTVLKKNKLALVYYIHNNWSIFKSGQSNTETITIYKKL